MPYQKKIQKSKSHMTHTLISADISIFLREINNQRYIKKYRLIDLSTQKGCMAKVPGSSEDMPLVWKELKAPKTNKLNFAAVW